MIIRKLYANQPVGGEIGIEIELEGKNVGQINARGWSNEADGSLRGESAELVLRVPVDREEVREYLDRVTAGIKKASAVPVDTGRAGVHVHVNVQELTVKELFNLICGYLIFEVPLTRFCGGHREGNLFCLRARDAEQLISVIVRSLREKNFWEYADNIRYAALNLSSLAKYGSLEFRAMRSTVDMDCIHKWVTYITKIKDWSKQFNDPQEIIQEFSIQGPQQIFSFLRDEGLEAEDADLYEGVRYAQQIAYSTDWDFTVRSEYQKVLENCESKGIQEHLKEMLLTFPEKAMEDDPRFFLIELLNFRKGRPMWQAPVRMKKPRHMQDGYFKPIFDDDIVDRVANVFRPEPQIFNQNNEN